MDEKSVRVKEDTLAVLSQSPAVDLGLVKSFSLNTEH